MICKSKLDIKSHRTGWPATNKSLTVVVWGSEGVFLHRPARRKDDKVSDGGTGTMAGTGQYGKNARILERSVTNGVDIF